MNEIAWCREEQRRQRWQWGAIVVSTVFVALRVVLDDAPSWLLTIVVLGAIAAGLAMLVVAWPTLTGYTRQARAARDAWKELDRGERRRLRVAIRERSAIRSELLPAAELLTRTQIEQGRSGGWVGAALALIPLGQRLPWAVLLAVPALLVAVGIVWVQRELTARYASIAVQRDEVTP